MSLKETEYIVQCDEFFVRSVQDLPFDLSACQILYFNLGRFCATEF